MSQHYLVLSGVSAQTLPPADVTERITMYWLPAVVTLYLNAAAFALGGAVYSGMGDVTLGDVAVQRWLVAPVLIGAPLNLAAIAGGLLSRRIRHRVAWPAYRQCCAGLSVLYCGMSLAALLAPIEFGGTVVSGMWTQFHSEYLVFAAAFLLASVMLDGLRPTQHGAR